MKQLMIVLALVLLLPMVGEGQSIQYKGPSGAFNINDLVIFDDFIGSDDTTLRIGDYGWRLATASIVAPGSAVIAGRLGVIGVRVAAGPASGILMLGGGASGTGIYTGSFSTLRSVLWVAAFPTLANQATKRAGLIPALPTDDSVYFECLSTDTNWFAVTRDAGDPNFTRTDTGVAFSGGTYVRFRIDHPSPTLYQFFIDDAPVATHTTGQNLPAEASGFWPAINLITTGTQGDVYVDLFALRAVMSR